MVSVSFGISSGTHVGTTTHTANQSQRTNTVVVLIVKRKLKTAPKIKKAVKTSANRASIFGTVLDSKAFLIATSELSLDKEDYSPVQGTAQFDERILGGSLLSGVV